MQHFAQLLQVLLRNFLPSSTQDIQDSPRPSPPFNCQFCSGLTEENPRPAVTELLSLFNY